VTRPGLIRAGQRRWPCDAAGQRLEGLCGQQDETPPCETHVSSHTTATDEPLI